MEGESAGEEGEPLQPPPLAAPGRALTSPLHLPHLLPWGPIHSLTAPSLTVSPRFVSRPPAALRNPQGLPSSPSCISFSFCPVVELRREQSPGTGVKAEVTALPHLPPASARRLRWAGPARARRGGGRPGARPGRRNAVAPPGGAAPAGPACRAGRRGGAGASLPGGATPGARGCGSRCQRLRPWLPSRPREHTPGPPCHPPPGDAFLASGLRAWPAAPAPDLDGDLALVWRGPRQATMGRSTEVDKRETWRGRRAWECGGGWPCGWVLPSL